MSKQKRKNAFKDDLDGEYIGNVFGWKVSIIGLVVITSFIGLYFFASRMNENKVVPDTTNHTIQNEDANISTKDSIDLQ